MISLDVSSLKLKSAFFLKNNQKINNRTPDLELIKWRNLRQKDNINTEIRAVELLKTNLKPIIINKCIMFSNTLWKVSEKNVKILQNDRESINQCLSFSFTFLCIKRSIDDHKFGDC